MLVLSQKLVFHLLNYKDIKKKNWILTNVYIYKENQKRKYNVVTLWGSEASQKTPSCPHKSIVVVQFKDPFDVNELYQSTKIVCSSGCNTPMKKAKR